jgi:GNAT superfamily N-acetyltransferase
MVKTNTAVSLAWRVEETCLNAWPALREIVLEGWLVRFAEGISRRLNSANPLSAQAAITDAVISETEAFYRRHGLPAIFRVPTLCPPAVEQALDSRGYTVEGETCVLHGALDDMDTSIDGDVVLRPRADRIWFAAMAGLQGHGGEAAHVYRRIVGALSIPGRFASLTGKDGRIVSMAYGTIHNRMLCYDMVVTDARERRRGHSRKIVTALAGWAKAEGATDACLQVVADNIPARTLYDQIGLTSEVYRYHYRRAPVGD